MVARNSQTDLHTRVSSGIDENPWGKQGLGSILIHLGVVASLVAYVLIVNHIHGKSWGNQSQTQGAIEATMVSSAPAIPLPQDQKPTDQVLATETPSPAPAPPAPKEIKAEEKDSIPIPTKEKVKVKLQPKKQVEQQKPIKVPMQHVPLVPAPVQQTQPRHSTYGAAAPAAVQQSMTQAAPAKQVNVQGGNFGAMFPWYVDLIKRTTAQNWYVQEVDPGTQPGARVYLTFEIRRDGSPTHVQVQQSSGSPTLDSSCVRAVQRVETYGPLPNGYTGSTLLVQYYCEQPRR